MKAMKIASSELVPMMNDKIRICPSWGQDLSMPGGSLGTTFYNETPVPCENRRLILPQFECMG